MVPGIGSLWASDGGRPLKHPPRSTLPMPTEGGAYRGLVRNSTQGDDRFLDRRRGDPVTVDCSRLPAGSFDQNSANSAASVRVSGSAGRGVAVEGRSGFRRPSPSKKPTKSPPWGGSSVPSSSRWRLSSRRGKRGLGRLLAAGTEGPGVPDALIAKDHSKAATAFVQRCHSAILLAGCEKTIDASQRNRNVAPILFPVAILA